ncbi:hypothetical protein [Pollutimonas nitritireducens]|uniref:hypothetical protein n=1 Tax=Pollutimonas nitritireducens TaxID=2045209 RepID=UPI00117F9EC9|nr:hypothetical protein [Pollutimonas nitritireducens]
MSELPETPEDPSAPSTNQQKEGERRTLGNHPADPNAWPNKVNIPPGIKPEEAIDPGNAIPGSAPVDNRSGKQEKHN